MNGEEKDVMIEFAGKLGSLTEAIQSLRTTTERIERKMDKNHESWQENCRRLRQDCGAVKAIPTIFEKLKALSDRLSKVETNSAVQKMTWKLLAKIVTAAGGAAGGVIAALKALGILK